MKALEDGLKGTLFSPCTIIREGGGNTSSLSATKPK
jgi:hypothetical protein